MDIISGGKSGVKQKETKTRSEIVYNVSITCVFLNKLPACYNISNESVMTVIAKSC